MFNRALSLGLDELQGQIEDAGDDDELRDLLTEMRDELADAVPQAAPVGEVPDAA